jgi:hypothetical protein
MDVSQDHPTRSLPGFGRHRPSRRRLWRRPAGAVKAPIVANDFLEPALNPWRPTFGSLRKYSDQVPWSPVVRTKPTELRAPLDHEDRRATSGDFAFHLRFRVRLLLVGRLGLARMGSWRFLFQGPRKARAGLLQNSLLTGNFTGNFANFGLQDLSTLQEAPVPQPFLSQFPTQKNREEIRKNREFFQNNRELRERRLALGKLRPQRKG